MIRLYGFLGASVYFTPFFIYHRTTCISIFYTYKRHFEVVNYRSCSACASIQNASTRTLIHWMNLTYIDQDTHRLASSYTAFLNNTLHKFNHLWSGVTLIYFFQRTRIQRIRIGKRNKRFVLEEKRSGYSLFFSVKMRRCTKMVVCNATQHATQVKPSERISRNDLNFLRF